MIAAVRADAMRLVETPNAAMTTVASPTQGPTDGISLWRIVMEAGQRGPRHTFDAEQVWHVLTGEVDFTVDDETVRLHAGDAVVLAQGAERQVTAVTAAEMVACGPATAKVTAVGERESRGTPPWIS